MEADDWTETAKESKEVNFIIRKSEKKTHRRIVKPPLSLQHIDYMDAENSPPN
jgi:hypothetical protein